MRFPNVAREIDARAKVDQDMRLGLDKGGIWDHEIDPANTAWMREVVKKIGWPTISKVGKLSASNAWLLVQHADLAVDFQEHCLALMEAEPAEEVDRRQIAMLTDRVRVNTGRPQIYGTQFCQQRGKHIPREIEDPEHVDEHRARMGLGTLEQGIASMYKSYGVPKS